MNGTQAILPENFEGPTIASMKPGEVAYTMPWAMWADSERRCWLNPRYPAESRSGGTLSMRVELRADGYHVWPPAGHKYAPLGKTGYANSADVRYLPVTGLNTD